MLIRRYAVSDIIPKIEVADVNAKVTIAYYGRGDQFFKKLWCCVGAK